MTHVDNPQTIETALEWFYGCGGNHLGLSRALPNLRAIAACEIGGYPVANLIAKMESGRMAPFPVWSDCKTFPCEIFRGLVDWFIASYPCQGFSINGLREGYKDPRFLWPYVLRATLLIQPRGVWFENVDGHVSLGLSTVLSDLEEAGFRTTWGIFSAEEVGSPQSRKRVFIMGLAKGQRFKPRRLPGGTITPNAIDYKPGEALADSEGERFGKTWGFFDRPEKWIAGSGEAVADTIGQGLEGTWRRTSGAKQEVAEPASGCKDQWPAPQGPFQHKWEPPRTIESGVGRNANGLSNWSDRIHMLGNAVVPATAELAFRTLYSRLANRPF